MKSKLFMIPLALSALMLSGCFSNSGSSKKKGQSSSGVVSTSGGSSNSNQSSATSGASSSPSVSTSISYPDDPYIPSSGSSTPWVDDLNADFSITNSKGENSGFTYSNGTYTITTADTYTLEGVLTGQINIEVGDGDEVTLELKGVKITSTSYAPIYAKSAAKLRVKAVKDTTNFIYDNRSAKTSDSDTQGDGAIAAKCDLNLIGSGQLLVEGNYNNGVHTSKDLKIKNLQLRTYGYQHAIRGGNSITILNNSTVIEATGKTGCGLKTNDAGTTSKGNQKGTIAIYGGNTTINCYNDAISAAYNVDISAGTDEDSGELSLPTINVYTGSKATLTKATSTISPHGINANNEVNISNGSIYIEAAADGIHANKVTLTDSDGVSTGQTGKGNINISGGTITVKATDDGIHADIELNISGGVINVLQSKEGIEGFNITISGGHTVTTATNDGANAGGKVGTGTPSFVVSGGYLEINVSPNGDLDGIDSNGTYTQTGGIVITKGPNSNNMSALDHQDDANISGGTIIVLGAIEGQSGGGGSGGGWWLADRGPGGGMPGSGEVTVGSNMPTYSLSLHSQGSHTITVSGQSYTFTNSYTYGKTTCYSDVAVTGS